METGIINANYGIACRSTTPAAQQQPAQSPYGENQYRNHNNRQRHNVVNWIGKNVIWISRLKAVETFKSGWQRC